MVCVMKYRIQNNLQLSWEQFAALSGQNVRTNHTENTAVRTNHTENTAVTNQKDFRIYKQSFQKGEIVL